jgi:hypothetical protein
MVVLEETDPELFERVQELNLIRQYDLLTNCIEIGLRQGPLALDKYTIWALNHVAVANISQFGGRFREEPIYLESHIPPHFREVPELMDRFLSTIHENWYGRLLNSLLMDCGDSIGFTHLSKGMEEQRERFVITSFVHVQETCFQAGKLFLNASATTDNLIIRRLRQATLRGKPENST